MSSCNRKTTIHGFVAGIGCLMLVVACQPSTPPVKTAGSRLSTQVTPTITLEQGDEPDIVGTLIDQVEENRLNRK